MATAEPPKKYQKVDKGSNIEASAKSDEEDVSPSILEYADIKNSGHLGHHLSAPIKDVLAEGRMKLHMAERAIHAWFVHPEKHIKLEVHIFLVGMLSLLKHIDRFINALTFIACYLRFFFSLSG